MPEVSDKIITRSLWHPYHTGDLGVITQLEIIGTLDIPKIHRKRTNIRHKKTRRQQAVSHCFLSLLYLFVCLSIFSQSTIA